MPFFNESIPKADRPWFESFGLVSPFTDKPVTSSKWVIDRERKMFLARLAGDGTEKGEYPMYYAFVCDSAIVKIEAYESSKGTPQTAIEVTRRLPKIYAPNTLNISNSALLALLDEAFQAEGLMGGLWRDKVTTVHVELSNPVRF